MRHRVAGNRLSRPANRRKALFRTLLSSLFTYGRITTTLAKAKAINGEADRLINLLKSDSVSGIREAVKALPQANNLTFLRDVKTRYPGKKSGYTRIIHLGERFSDTSRMAILELISETLAVEPVAVETKAQVVEKPVVREAVLAKTKVKKIVAKKTEKKAKK